MQPTPPPQPDPVGDPRQCASTDPVHCAACCEQQFPDGVQLLQLTEQDCVCSRMGCASTCSYQDCAALASTDPTCASCLQANASTCAQQVTTACQGDPYCKAYRTCLADCPQ